MIPRTFHRIWLDEPVPERYEAYWRRLRELHPGWELYSWERSDELGWLQNRELFESFPAGEKASYGFRADVLRYELLNRFGGVYVDTDVEPLRPMDALLEDGRPFVAWCSAQELDPAVIASPAYHPAIRQLVDDLELVREYRSAGRATSPPGSTGPRYVTARWRAREDVLRLPPSAFFPYHWSETEPGVQRPPWPERTLAAHHWSAGWKE